MRHDATELVAAIGTKHFKSQLVDYLEWNYIHLQFLELDDFYAEDVRFNVIGEPKDDGYEVVASVSVEFTVMKATSCCDISLSDGGGEVQFTVTINRDGDFCIDADDPPQPWPSGDIY